MQVWLRSLLIVGASLATLFLLPAGLRAVGLAPDASLIVTAVLITIGTNGLLYLALPKLRQVGVSITQWSRNRAARFPLPLLSDGILKGAGAARRTAAGIVFEGGKLARYKVLKSVAHRFGHSFTSLFRCSLFAIALGACATTSRPARPSAQSDAFISGKCFPESADTVSLGTLVPELGPEPPTPIQGNAPEYPLPMITAGVSGYVITTFVIDSSGRPPLGQIVVDRSTHPQFSRAVCRALTNFRWKPYSDTHPTAVIVRGARFEFETRPR